MSQRTGSADLPLHGGHVPQWLATRMARLGRVIVTAIAHEFGRDEVLRRLGDPFWFQSFGAVMGMDWHSSGITTSVIGALRRGLEPLQSELGLTVCGGRGKRSRRTPAELLAVGERTGLDGAALAQTSRLVAKVDNNAIQDGYQLYLHGFVVADDGNWCVVQQGMAPDVHYARRYHWLSEAIEDYVEQPHSGLDGVSRGEILNLTDARASEARTAQIELLEREGPTRIVNHLASLTQQQLHLALPAHHDPLPNDVKLKRLHAALIAAVDHGPKDFADLIAMPGIGPRTVESLALVAEVIYGAPSRFDDPARFSYAHGGKDGFPFAVPLDVYDQTINVLKRAMSQAALGQRERLDAIKRLDQQVKNVERVASGPNYAEIVATEKARIGTMQPRQVGSGGARNKARSAVNRRQLQMF
jgi:uncharacterized protein